MPLRDITLDELRAATKEQILTRLRDILTQMTKKRLCEWIWTIKNINPQDITIENLLEAEDTPQGQLKRINLLEDILGAKTGTRRHFWNYYPLGDVDTITTEHLNEIDDLTLTEIVKHYHDGRQPTLTRIE